MVERSESDVCQEPSVTRADRYMFGAFEFFPTRSVLLKEGQRVRIGSRALALLRALVENPGRFLPNDHLMAAGWPGTTVEETNLRVQMTALRRLLGHEFEGSPYISNAPGRGYALTASTFVAADAPQAARPTAKAHARPIGLPVSLSPIIGREEVERTVRERLSTRRLVSIVGPGGIGKTRLAIEVGWTMASASALRTVFVNLAPLAADGSVPGAIAVALDVDLSSAPVPLDATLERLRECETLLILDNCEHVIDAGAEVVERLLRSVPDLTILVTSREPMRVEGEVVVRLAGLDVPDDEAGDALGYAAVELFVECAAAHGDFSMERPEDLSLVAQICRRLDGIPLAIELAAARVGQVGLEDLARHLESQLSLLSEGRRTSLPRHRTLHATLEWSYASLAPDEQDLLCQLAVFRSPFTVGAAQEVAGLQPVEAMTLLSSLVNKSLIVTSSQQGQVRYRLLDTTRTFADEKLSLRPDQNHVRRRHASHLLEQFSAATSGEQARDLGSAADDVRKALAWSISGDGDPRLGARLAVASAPMWSRLSLLKEYAVLLNQLAQDLTENAGFERRELLPLYAIIHHAHYNAVGLAPTIQRMVGEGLDLARQESDERHELLFLYNLFGTRMTQGRYEEAHSYAVQFADVAARLGDVAQQAIGHRVLGLTLWRKGNLGAAIESSETALGSLAAAQHRPVGQSLLYRQSVTSRASHSNILWLSGQPDAALSLARDAVEAGLADDLAGLCYALAMTIVPLAFWTGDVALAAQYTGILIEQSRKSHFGHWLFWGRCYEALLSRVERRLAGPNDYLDRNAAQVEGLQAHILGTIVDELPHGLRAPPAEGNHWAQPELLRRRAIVTNARGHEQAALLLLDESLAAARSIGTRAWELRAATTAAEILLSKGEFSQARRLLEPVHSSFTEGHGTQDLRRAAAVLQQI